MRIPLTTIILTLLYLSAFGQAGNADSVRLQALLKLSRADSIRKDYVSALRHIKQYVHLEDSLLQVTNKRNINRLQQQYQTVQKDDKIKAGEKNINLLTSQSRLTAKNLQQIKAIRNMVLAVAGGAALFLIISYFQYRLKKQANLKMENQQIIINEKTVALQQLAMQKDGLLDEKELLIKEIHHRVKNNLQVVISLLNTQSVYLNDSHATAAIRQSQHRMQSISLIHQKLYQSESRALINMKEYVRELVQYLQQSFDTGTRIVYHLNIDDIDLDVLRAVPIGLILNEAITNAISYAFPADCNGTIEIDLNCQDSQQLKLSVKDNGTGLPTSFKVDTSQSLGFNLIKSMCRQIQGELMIENKNGVAITVDFPIENSLISLSPNDDISLFDDAKA